MKRLSDSFLEGGARGRIFIRVKRPEKVLYKVRGIHSNQLYVIEYDHLRKRLRQTKYKLINHLNDLESPSNQRFFSELETTHLRWHDPAADKFQTSTEAVQLLNNSYKEGVILPEKESEYQANQST